MDEKLSKRIIDFLSNHSDMFGPFLSGEDLTVRGLALFIYIKLGCQYRCGIQIGYYVDGNREDFYTVCYADSEYATGNKWGDGHTLEEALYNCLQEASISFECYTEYLDELNNEQKEQS